VKVYNGRVLMTAFLYVSLALFAVWAVLFLCWRPARREQVIMSLVGLALAPAILFLAGNGGQGVSAVIGVEDAVFAFSFFGVAAVCYEVLFGRHFAVPRGARGTPARSAVAWGVRLLLAVSAWVAASVALQFAFEISIVRAMAAAALLVGVYVVADRKDLLGNALASGFFMAGLVFLCEQLFFLRLYPAEAALRAGTGFIAGVSTDTLLWAAVAGFAVGPLYEYVRSLKANR